MELIDISKAYEDLLYFEKGVKLPPKLGKKLAAGALAGSMVAGGGAGAVKGTQAALHATAAGQQSARHALYDMSNAKRVAAGQPKNFWSFKDEEAFRSHSIPHRFGPS